MAVGIQFYRAQECSGLNDSLGTQEFTIKINMFDAMNRNIIYLLYIIYLILYNSFRRN